MSATARIREFLDTIEPEVIIECPSCQTRFRVEASKLSARDSGSDDTHSYSGQQSAKARFHCSRCDYVFSAEVSSASRQQAKSSEEIAPPQEAYESAEYDQQEQSSPASLKTENQQLSFNFSEAEQKMATGDEDAEISHPEVLGNELSKDSISHNSIAEVSDNPRVKVADDLENIHGTAYLDPDSVQKIVQGLDSLKDHHTDEQSDWNSESTQTARDISEAESTSEIEQTPSFAWDKPAAAPASTNNEYDQSPVDYSRYAQDFSHEERDAQDGLYPQNRDLNDSAYNQPSPETRNKSSEADFPATSTKKTGASSGISSFAILALPILITLSLLGAATLYLGNNLKSSEKLLETVFPDAMREAPSGVFIQQPRIEKLVLDNGDIVNVVYGTLINKSRKTLSALAIEALGFSDSGNIIASEKILAGNPVSENNATIRTLSPSDIRELQSKENKKFLMRPQSKSKFILVFTNTLNNTQSKKDSVLSSFAVRVHSARFREE